MAGEQRTSRKHRESQWQWQSSPRLNDDNKGVTIAVDSRSKAAGAMATEQKNGRSTRVDSGTGRHVVEAMPESRGIATPASNACSKQFTG
jgi:hypothetical protein